MRFDTGADLFVNSLAPDRIIAPSAAFNPLEAITRPAVIAAYSIPTQMLSGLAVLDPDTVLSLTSDIAQMLAAVPAEVGRGASYPAWSSHGDAVVFTGWPNDASLSAQPQAALDGSLIEATVGFDGSSFHFGPPKVLVHAAAGESNLRASFANDDTAIVFMRTVEVGAARQACPGLSPRRRTDPATDHRGR